MDRIEPTHIAAILARTPTWARLALAAPDARCRERGVETIAAILSERLTEPLPPIYDPRQMTLPIP